MNLKIPPFCPTLWRFCVKISFVWWQKPLTSNLTFHQGLKKRTFSDKITFSFIRFTVSLALPFLLFPVWRPCEGRSRQNVEQNTWAGPDKTQHINTYSSVSRALLKLLSKRVGLSHTPTEPPLQIHPSGFNASGLLKNMFIIK